MTGGNNVYSMAIVLVISGILVYCQSAQARSCKPTTHDEIGPFYRQNAPLRNKIGTGYVLQGKVLDTECRPIPTARIEIWQAGPKGEYGDQFRATLYPDKRGRYRFETFMPPPYLNRPPHIHILVDAKGTAGLITQHYPKKGEKKARFDLVLELE